MSKVKTALILAALLYIIILIPAVKADDGEQNYSVPIQGFGGYELRTIEGTKEGDSVYIEVYSDIIVDIYILSFDAWTYGEESAIWWDEDQTYASFYVDIPDGQQYYILIENYNYDTAWVDYSYRIESNAIDPAASLLCIICGVSAIGFALVGGIILLIIILNVSKKKKKKKGYEKEIDDLEKKIKEMEELGLDTKKERKLLAKYKRS